MERVLDYSNLETSFRNRLIASAAAVAAFVGGMLALGLTIHSAQDLVGTFGGCATGRQGAAFGLLCYPPLASAIPASAWRLVAHSKSTALCCRCSLWAGLAAWLTAHAIFMLR